MRITESRLRKIVREEISSSDVSLVTESSNDFGIKDLEGVRQAVGHVHNMGSYIGSSVPEEINEQFRVLCMAIHRLTEILENEYEKKEKES